MLADVVNPEESSPILKIRAAINEPRGYSSEDLPGCLLFEPPHG
jgi:hypothetical protein